MNNVLNKKNRVAFTLLETLLYISVSTVILSVIASFVFLLWQTKLKNELITEVEQQGALAMNYMIKNIKNSKQIISPNLGEVSDNLSLLLENPESEALSFSLTNSNLAALENNQDLLNLNSDKVFIEDLKFVNSSRASTPGLITISFKISGRSYLGKNELFYSANFYDSGSIKK